MRVMDSPRAAPVPLAGGRAAPDRRMCVRSRALDVDRIVVGPHARALVSLIVAITLCAAVFCFHATSVAGAAQAHAPAASFPESPVGGHGANQLSLLAPDLVEEEGRTGIKNFNLAAAGSGVAVDEQTHDVYVADTNNHRVAEFSSSGTFVRVWGWGVSDGQAKLETCSSSCEEGLSGAGPGQFEIPVFVTVDNSSGASAGDVYVGDSGDTLISKFSSSGALIETWGNNGPGPGKLRMASSMASQGNASALSPGSPSARPVIFGCPHRGCSSSRQKARCRWN